MEHIFYDRTNFVMTIDWQLVYQESQNLAIAMKNDMPWRVFRMFDFFDWVEVGMALVFLLIPIFILVHGFKNKKEYGNSIGSVLSIFFLFEIFGVVGFSVVIYNFVIKDKIEFSTVPYLVTLQNCDTLYEGERFYIVGITQKQEEITTEGLINLEEYQYTDKDYYWVSEEVFDYAQKDTINQLIIINDTPLGIVNFDGSFYLDY